MTRQGKKRRLIAGKTVPFCYLHPNPGCKNDSSDRFIRVVRLKNPK